MTRSPTSTLLLSLRAYIRAGDADTPFRMLLNRRQAMNEMDRHQRIPDDWIAAEGPADRRCPFCDAQHVGQESPAPFEDEPALSAGPLDRFQCGTVLQVGTRQARRGNACLETAAPRETEPASAPLEDSEPAADQQTPPEDELPDEQFRELVDRTLREMQAAIERRRARGLSAYLRAVPAKLAEARNAIVR